MILGFSITKSVSFRGVQQEFSNVYHYYLPAALTAPYESLLDELKAAEVQFHATDVSFKRGSVWTAGGTAAQNQMMFQKNFTGTGSTLVTTSFDRERAVLIQWPAGLNSLGKPVFLRKWYHSCGHSAGVTLGSAQLQQTSPISDADRATLATAASAFNEIGVAEVWDLCSATGRVWEGQPVAHKWLEHHQLGDMWR